MQWIVTENIELLSFLYQNIQDSKNNIKTRLKNGDVLVDGESKTKHDLLLSANQTVSIRKMIQNELQILFEDNDLIVIEKPAGLLTIANEIEKERTAYHMVSDYCKQKRKTNKIFVVHRLDQETSGIVMFAKNESIKQDLQEHWDDLVKTRGYMALVEGIVDKKEGTVHTWLKETKTKLVYSTQDKRGKEAITNYQVIKYIGNRTLLEIHLLTGRKNQIRVHMKDIGHPIVGDSKYGTKGKRLYLHAYLLEWIHPRTHKRIMTKLPSLEKYL